MMVTKVLLVILILMVIALGVLYYLGKKMQAKQDAAQPAFEAAKQTVSLLVIDKKKLRVTEAGFPSIVAEQTPWYTRWMKVPVVKAKIGAKIMTFMADATAFEQLPVKQEARVVCSGIYICEVKSVRGGIPQLPKKRSLMDRVLGRNKPQVPAASAKKKN